MGIHCPTAHGNGFPSTVGGMPGTVSYIFGAGVPDLFVLGNLIAACLAYLWAARRIPRIQPGTRWPAHRTAFFLLGMGLLGYAYLGPFAAWSHTFFWAHMSQHLVVMMLAAPFIVLGDPLMLAFRASGPAGRRQLLGVMRSRPVTFATGPVFTWVFFAAVLLGTHFSPFFNWSIESHDLMAFVERPLYLVAALLFYYPIICGSLLPHRAKPAVRLASVSLMMLPETAVGLIIYFSPVVLYSAYANAVRPFGPDALDDQKLAGALMWALAMVIDTAWIMVTAVEWFQSEERQTRVLERQERQEQRA